ncbi:SIMPL domain-containing protein [Lachnospiraceae bacterium NSJ-143]|nr:SIMPL domain-containing protein [Lachnospiraceae bacterium NSJ-143]
MKKILCSLVIASMSLMPAVQAFAYELPANTIAVTGKGVVTAKPDIAEINMSIVTNDKDASKAQQKNNDIYNKACAALKASGIKAEDIKSTWYYVYPERDYEKTNEVTGYRVENNFCVKTNDRDNTGKYIDEALKAGVTGVDGVSFSVENPQYYYNSALKLAVANAQASAETLAKAVGAGNIKVYSMEEQSNRYSYATSNAMMKEEAYDISAGGQTEISYDDIEITASINAVYSYQ